MANRTVEFFYDIASSYSYLAAMKMDDFAASNPDVDIEWKPFFVGGVFKATGNEMPAALPAKEAYLSKDMAMNAEQIGVPCTSPEAFPILSVGLLRAIIDVQRKDSAEQANKLAKALFRAYWGAGRDVSDPNVFTEVVTDAGFDAERLAAANDDPENKQVLRDHTEDAVARGAFGAPTFFVGDTMFWGSDRMPLLEWYLREK